MNGMFSIDKGLSHVMDAHHIAYAWSVKITGLERTGNRIPTLSFLKSLEEAVMVYINTRMQPPLLRPCAIGSRGLITRLTFAPLRSRHYLRMIVILESSERFPLSDPTRAKQSILALPAAIDFAGSIATIHRTLVLNSCAWNSCSVEGWQKPLGNSLSIHRTRHELRLP